MNIGPPRLTTEAARRLTLDAQPWLSCDDCFDQIDQYVDGLIVGTARITPPLRAHLIGCNVCREEAQSLLTLVAGEQGMNPRQALACLELDLDLPADGRAAER